MTNYPLLNQTKDLCTYPNNNKIKPTPSVREIFLISKRSPFYKHFYDENSSEKLVGNFKNLF